MKKITKTMLIGAGIAATGYLGYSILKNPKKTAPKPSDRKETSSEFSPKPSGKKGTPINNSTKDFVERRKKRMREKAAARASEKKTASDFSPDHVIPTPDIVDASEIGNIPKGDLASQKSEDAISDSATENALLAIASVVEELPKDVTLTDHTTKNNHMNTTE